MREKPNNEKPNIVLMFTDQQRWDTLRVYGNALIHTPNLDRLALEGAIFDNATTPCPLCAPARACTMTGLAAGRTGVFDNESAPAVDEGDSLAMRLREQGYYTQAIGKMHFTPQGQTYGMDGLTLSEEMRGVRTAGTAEEVEFDDYDRFLMKRGVWGWEKPPEIGYNELKPLVNGLPKECHITQWCGDRTVEWLENERPKDQPFFLWTSFVKPHAPFDCPQHLIDLYDPAKMPKPWRTGEEGQEDNPLLQEYRDAMEEELYSEAAIAKNKAYYYANITFIDEQVGRIMRALKEQGLEKNTLVVFTSDHGELLGDHRLWYKKLGYEGSVHIPLLAKWPGRIEPGTRCGEVASLLDLFPTFVNAADGSMPERAMPGVDLMDLLSGKKTREAVCSEFYVAPNYLLHVRSREWKYLFYQNGGFESLFHLGEDPHELNDLAGDPHYAEVKEALKSAAEQWIREHSDPELALGGDGKLKSLPYQGKAASSNPSGNPRPFSRMPWDSRVPPSTLPMEKRSWFWRAVDGDWSTVLNRIGGTNETQKE
ncbi:sulfatase-like hydrolase/transferase [Paenibacillus sp. HB172176]|uniref:sulfatase family protein n=1 Tax=Paenibacillus sp. HB172176 TaxID=2493690 RepID=UPI001439C388|nr:sulfatase-like hydrolase/transferase [Paenibacillus sp. HB172176]